MQHFVYDLIFFLCVLESWEIRETLKLRDTQDYQQWGGQFIELPKRA